MFEKHHDPRIRALERGTVYFIVLIAIVLTEIMKFSKVMFLLEKKICDVFIRKKIYEKRIFED